jgi:hypothetical protein
MAWYWIVGIILVIIVLVSLTGKSRKKPESSGEDDLDFIFQAARQQAAQREQAPPLDPVLKPYITRLRRVHSTVGSFASPETRTIGQEIYDQHGHEAMVAVCDELRRVLGGGPARDLEYKWGGIGIWMG